MYGRLYSHWWIKSLEIRLNPKTFLSLAVFLYPKGRAPSTRPHSGRNVLVSDELGPRRQDEELCGCGVWFSPCTAMQPFPSKKHSASTCKNTLKIFLRILLYICYHAVDVFAICFSFLKTEVGGQIPMLFNGQVCSALHGDLLAEHISPAHIDAGTFAPVLRTPWLGQTETCSPCLYSES